MVKLFRRATFGDEVSAVHDGLIHLRGGAPRVIVGTSSLNFEGLAPEQQLRSVQAFRELLHAQSGPMQLYLRIRRVPGGDEAEPEAAAFADHAEVFSVQRGLRMSLQAPENALQVFKFGSHVRARLVWFNPDAATPAQDDEVA